MSSFSAQRWMCSAIEIAPITMSPLTRPEANLPPPVETWIMPSDFASAKALRAALAVTIELTLMAG